MKQPLLYLIELVKLKGDQSLTLKIHGGILVEIHLEAAAFVFTVGARNREAYGLAGIEIYCYISLFKSVTVGVIYKLCAVASIVRKLGNYTLAGLITISVLGKLLRKHRLVGERILVYKLVAGIKIIGIYLTVLTESKSTH